MAGGKFDNPSSMWCLHFSLSTQPQLTRYSPKILCLDLSDHASLADKCREALGFYGRVDILINNAGVSSRASVLDTDLAVDRKVMEVNFFGTIGLTKGNVDNGDRIWSDKCKN